MMKVETTLAQSLRTLDGNAQYDAACKRLLSEKIILAWIMRSCLEEYRDIDVNEIAEKYIEGPLQVSTVPVSPDETNAAPRIQGIGTEDKTLTEGTVVYDIRFTAVAPVSGELIRLIINVEAQGSSSVGYPVIKRAIYYCSRMISAQYGTEFTRSQYGEIKKVYSIFICVSPLKEAENTITRYRITEENMVGDVHEAVKNYDLMTAIMLCLGDPDGENYRGVLKLLGTLFSNEAAPVEKQQILENDFGIQMTETLGKELQAMCNLSEGIEAKGFARGIEKGRAEGRIEGILASLQSLMDSMGLTLEQAMNTLKISEGDRLKCRGLMEKQ